MNRWCLLLALAAFLAAADPVALPQTVAGVEDTALNVLLAGSDGDGDPLAYEVTALPLTGKLFDGAVEITSVPHAVTDPGHAVRYVPAADDNGPGRGSFAFHVHDGAVWSPPAAVTIDLTPVNDPPVMTVVAAWTVPEGVMLEIPVTGIGPGGGADEAGQRMYAVLVDPDPLQGANKAVYYTPGATTARVLVQDNLGPGVLGDGITELILSLVDDGGTASGGANITSVVITVTATQVNDIPYIESLQSVTVAIGGSAVVSANAVAIKDLDLPAASTLVFTLADLPFDGRLEKDGVAMAIGDSASMEDVGAGRLVYFHTGSAAGLDGAAFTYTDGIITAPRFGDIWFVIGSYTAPRIATWGIDDPVWGEGDADLDFAIKCTVEDADTASFTGGSLIASIVDGLRPDDVLSVASGGFASGQIGVLGNVVSYGGVVIGVLSGGTDGQPLRIDLEGAAATPAALTELAHAMRFHVVGDDPGDATRVIELVANDGDAGASPPAAFRVHVVPVDDAPSLSDSWIGLAAGVARDIELAVVDPDTAAPSIAMGVVPTQAVVTILDAVAHRMRIVPVAGAVGSDRFTVLVDDGVNPVVEVEVALTITGADDARPLAAGEFPGEVVADSVLSVDIPFDCRQIGDPASLDFALAGDPPAGLALTPVSAAQPTVRATWNVPAAEPLGHRSFQILAIDPVGRSVGVLPVLLPVRARPAGGG